MLFNVATAGAALLALSGSAIAAPQRHNAGNASGSNMCDVSTFNDGADYSIPQASADDCTGLIQHLDRTQKWTVDRSWARLETYGTCAFSVRVILGDGGLVGGADMYDLIHDSVAGYGKEGVVSCTGQFAQVVSAEGEVACNTTPDGATQVRVEWIVADSSYNPPA
ncbi:hypothetical protein CERZMDRAFT_53627 [Cercospora zeae-maydis SCOH1-5]|uniref:Ecp2 effector protein-like domain-containing protein n=1 Tax=Cercospora zeae-maydis SCOH1-5 TaxID=717836 RepID=A0A6A6F137_9PEZI|nr:hypothetical protein CERZMDRAFT_53627 [Cercospora zeae-maydis SCOH1-5]